MYLYGSSVEFDIFKDIINRGHVAAIFMRFVYLNIGHIWFNWFARSINIFGVI